MDRVTLLIVPVDVLVVGEGVKVVRVTVLAVVEDAALVVVDGM